MNYEISPDLFWKILKFFAKLCSSDLAYIRETALECLLSLIENVPE